MDRRAFLLGALAAPIAAPAIAKAAAEPATGGIVRAIRPMVIGEAGAEMIVPAARAIPAFTIVSVAPGANAISSIMIRGNRLTTYEAVDVAPALATR